MSADTQNRHYTIVIADDDIVMCSLLYVYCTNAGRTDISAFANGADALTCVNQLETLDLLVTDLVMPKMRGDALIPEVRKKFPEVQVILVSCGNNDGFKRAEEIAHDLNASFYKKPITNVTGFIKKVQSMLSNNELYNHR